MKNIKYTILLLSLFLGLNIGAFATPIDSSFQKSLQDFREFINKNEEKKGKDFIFSFQQTPLVPLTDGTYEQLANGGTPMFPGTDATTTNYYNQALAKIATFNTGVASYDAGNFAIYIFHGRFWKDAQYALISGNTDSGYQANTNNATSASALDKLLEKRKIAFDDKVLPNIFSQMAKFRADLRVAHPNKRIIVVFAMEYYRLMYNSYNVWEKDQGIAANSMRPLLHTEKQVLWYPIALNNAENNISKALEKTLEKNIITSFGSYTAQTTITANNNVAIELDACVKLLTGGLMFQKNRSSIFTACSSLQIYNSLFATAHPSMYKLLTVAERIRLLTLIATTNSRGAMERFALDILKETPSADVDKLLEDLEKPISFTVAANTATNTPGCNTTRAEVLISALMYRIDDGFFIGDNNYTELLGIITGLILKAESYESRLEELFSHDDFALRNVAWEQTENIGNTKISDVSLNTANGEVNYKVEKIESITANPILSGSGTTVTGYTYTPVYSTPVALTTPLKPFDLILFANLGQLTILDEGVKEAPAVVGANPALGPMVVVPAIFMKYAQTKKNFDVYQNATISSVCVVLDVVTAMKGVPAFTAMRSASIATKLSRAYIGVEIVNAAGNIVLVTNKAAFKNTKFELFVELTDYMVLAHGVKTLAQASNSFSNVYKNLDNFDERNLKYYLASYEKVRGQLNEMKLAPFNVSDAQIAAYEQVFLTMEKNLKRSEKGKKMLADAKILAGGNLKLSNFLENTPKISFQGTTIRGVKFNTTDNFIDVIVHANANGYKILIEKQGTYVYQNITADDLASIITQNAPISSNKTLRLLSCSNLESAKTLSSALGGRKILASNSSVTLFLDGTDNVSSIRSSDWYEIQKVGNDITQTKTTLNFDNGNTQKWVKMGVLKFSEINAQNYASYFKEITDAVTGSGCTSNCTVVAISAAKKLKGEPILEAQKFTSAFVNGGEDGIGILNQYADLVPIAIIPTNPQPHRILSPTIYTNGVNNMVFITEMFNNLPNNSSLIFASYVGGNYVGFKGHAFNVIKDENGVVKFFDVQDKDVLEYGVGVGLLYQKMLKHGIVSPSILSEWHIYNASILKK